MQVHVYLLDRLCRGELIFDTNFVILGAPRQMISKQWKSVKLSITLGFLCRLIKLCNLVKAGHKTWFTLEIFECGAYQNNNSQCKLTHSWMDLLAIIELQCWGFPGVTKIWPCGLRSRLRNFMADIKISLRNSRGQSRNGEWFVPRIISIWRVAGL